MENVDLIQQLKDRGMITQVTDEKLLSQRLNYGPISVYCGFDPTADSLHLGHLMPLLCLKRFQLAGHRPIVMIGVATGMIGDPSLKATERRLNTEEIVHAWADKIQKQISNFLDFNCGYNSAIATNNYDWFGSMTVIKFLRHIGKHFSINQMINKETIKQRLNREDHGISFTEFSYNLLQGYDFTNLYKKYGVELQIGGSDQWGNIISGVSLTRRLHKHTVFGLTFPLITKSDGTKFGKTEGDTIWLNKAKTSPYKFYQFWINICDEDVYRFLKFFTFIDLEAINIIKEADQKSVSHPKAQYLLAEIATRIVHGENGLAAAKRITSSLFNTSELTTLTENDLEQLVQDGISSIRLTHGVNLQQALVAAKLTSSSSQARSLIESNAITINGKKEYAVNYVFSDADRLFNRFTLLRRGKKNYCLINWE